MVVFDSNIFIYVATRQLDLSIIRGVKACYASVTAVETLGFHQITSVEERALTRILNSYDSIDLSPSIILRAIVLRQDKKMSLGDAIIAATALEHDLPLWTANSEDFAHIDSLKLVNPLT